MQWLLMELNNRFKKSKFFEISYFFNVNVSGLFVPLPQYMEHLFGLWIKKDI